MSRLSRSFPKSIGFTINHLKSNRYEEYSAHRPCVGRSAGPAGFTSGFILTGKTFLRIEGQYHLFTEPFVLLFQQIFRIYHQKFVFRQILIIGKEFVFHQKLILFPKAVLSREEFILR